MRKTIKTKDANGEEMFQIWEYSDETIQKYGECLATGLKSEEEAEKKEKELSK